MAKTNELPTVTFDVRNSPVTVALPSVTVPDVVTESTLATPPTVTIKLLLAAGIDNVVVPLAIAAGSAATIPVRK